MPTDAKIPTAALTNIFETENIRSATVGIYSPVPYKSSEFVFTTK